MSEPARDRWLSIGMSVLLHGTIIGLLAYGWWRYEHRPVTPSVSIDATVVDAHTLKGVGVAHHPMPKPPPQRVSPPQGPPAPTPQEVALRQQAAQAEAARVAAAKAEHERLQRQQAQAKAAAEAKAESEQKAKAQAKAEALAKARAEARKRARARKLADARRKREEAKKLAQARKLAAEQAAKARAERIAQLRQALREDARSNAQMRTAMAGWATEVKQRVEAAWIKPPTARSNLSCTVRVVLVPGGAVTNVSLGQCNGDGAVRESIEAAVYRASPLPPPPDPQLYHQQLNFVFAPNSP